MGLPPTGFRRVLRSADLPLPEPAAEHDEAEPCSHPTIREVEVEGYRVLVTRLPSGEVAAFATFCPHLGTPLQRATLVGEHLRCPQHRYVYDLRSGRNVVPTDRASSKELRRLRPGCLPTFPAAEEGGWVWVAATAHGSGSA